MAPELLQDKHMSKATDVYSFAVLLWEIAAQGESPFSGIDAVDVITAVVKHDLRPKFAENAFQAVDPARHAVLAR
jgi:serine/threonine protein kinase